MNERKHCEKLKIANQTPTTRSLCFATRQASTVARGMWASKSNPMGLRMRKGMCPVAGRACQVAGVDEGFGVGDVNERRTM
jgi:hypothetical protein